MITCLTKYGLPPRSISLFLSSSGDVPQHISSPRRQYASSGHPLRKPSAPVKQATKAPVSPSKPKLATTSSASTVSKPSREPILTSSVPHSSKIIRTPLKPKLSLPSPASLLRSIGSPRRVMPGELITFEESQRIGPVYTFSLAMDARSAMHGTVEQGLVLVFWF
jgi:hypothetical protein